MRFNLKVKKTKTMATPKPKHKPPQKKRKVDEFINNQDDNNEEDEESLRRSTRGRKVPAKLKVYRINFDDGFEDEDEEEEELNLSKSITSHIADQERSSESD